MRKLVTLSLFTFLISSNVQSQIHVEYDSNAGCGKIYKNNQFLKKHCGWRNDWEVVLNLNCDALFYDRENGEIEIYWFDDQGNMELRRRYSNIRTTWTKITWAPHSECRGILKFEQQDGYVEGYLFDRQEQNYLYNQQMTAELILVYSFTH